MTLKLNGSSSGSVSIDAPASTTGGADVTLTLPVNDGDANQLLKTNGSGALSWGGGGKILQVLQSTKTDVFSTQAQTPADVDGTDQAGSGSVWCVKITPASSSNKVLFQWSVGIGSNQSYSIILALRDTTELIKGDASGSMSRSTWGSYISGTGTVFNAAGSFLDSPSSTSELTYKLKVGNPYSSGYYTVVNRSHTSTDASHNAITSSMLTVMEVEG